MPSEKGFTVRVLVQRCLKYWRTDERRGFAFETQIALVLGAVAYVVHYFLVDRPLGLTVDLRWTWYRFGMAGGAVTGALATGILSRTRPKWVRWPLGLFAIATGLTQAWSMVWHDAVPYIYAFAIPAFVVILLRTTAIKSGLLIVAIFVLQLPAFLRTSVDPYSLLSALVVSFSIVTIIRSQGRQQFDSPTSIVASGRSIGRYVLRRRLGFGGMGEVWAVWNPALKSEVAMKILKPLQVTANASVRFEREVRALCALNHPNTVRVFDSGTTDDGLFYYVMELFTAHHHHVNTRVDSMRLSA